MRRRLIGAVLALFLWAGPAAAQSGEKVSRLPVPELSKQKTGLVEEADPVAEPEVVALDRTADGELVLVYADEEVADAPSLPVPYDSTALTPRAVPEAGLERFLNDPLYDYERVETQRPSLLEVFFQWLNRVLFQPLDEHTSPLFWRILWLTLAILALAWLLARLLRADAGGLFRRRSRDEMPEGALLLDVEHIETVNLDRLLEQALADQHYRDAARFLYLRALQTLAARGLIDWQKNKTNREYLREVRRAARPGLDRPFADVTRLFEWIWYGEAAVDAERFAAVRARFDRFAEALTMGEGVR